MALREVLLTDAQWERVKPHIPMREICAGWPAAGRRSALSRGHTLDPQDGRSLEGSAKRVSLARNVLATHERVGRFRRARSCLEGVSRRTRRPATAELGRAIRRRDVLAGEKRGFCVGKTKRGKGTEWMLLVDGQGVPVTCRTASASPAEITLVEDLVAEVTVVGGQIPLIADRAYDSDPHRERLKARGFDLVCPHRRGRKRPPT